MDVQPNVSYSGVIREGRGFKRRGRRDGKTGVTYTIPVSPKTGLVSRVPVAVPVTPRPAPLVRSRSVRPFLVTNNVRCSTPNDRAARTPGESSPPSPDRKAPGTVKYLQCGTPAWVAFTRIFRLVSMRQFNHKLAPVAATLNPSPDAYCDNKCDPSCPGRPPTCLRYRLRPCYEGIISLVGYWARSLRASAGSLPEFESGKCVVTVSGYRWTSTSDDRRCAVGHNPQSKCLLIWIHWSAQ